MLFSTININYEPYKRKKRLMPFLENDRKKWKKEIKLL